MSTSSCPSAQARSVSAHASGWNCTPHADPTRNAWYGYIGDDASHTAPRGRSTTASACMLGCGVRWRSSASAATGPTTASPTASGRQRTSARPASRPGGAATWTRPPRATASSWAPRQMPSVGTPRVLASASSARSSGSQGASASECADMWPPSTTRPSPTSSASGTGSPAKAATTRRSTSPSQSAKRSRWTSGELWITVTTGRGAPMEGDVTRRRYSPPRMAMQDGTGRASAYMDIRPVPSGESAPARSPTRTLGLHPANSQGSGPDSTHAC